MLTTLDDALRQERAEIERSLVLTPVDNFPVMPTSPLEWARGLYVTDKVRTAEQSRSAEILFAGRDGLGAIVEEIHKRLADAFGGHYASARLLSGLHAHVVLFMGLAEPGDRVALLPVEAGGHLATPAILQRLGLEVLALPVDTEGHCVDVEAALKQLAVFRPDFVFIDRSEGLKYEDFSWVSRVENATKIFDASQYAAQIIHGQYQNPFEWGFDLQLMTLHKSFPGPQKAAIVGRDEGCWKRVLDSVGRFVSSSHIESTLSVASVFGQADGFRTYAERLVPTAISLDMALRAEGVSVFDRNRAGPTDWPYTHHIWLTTKGQDEAFRVWTALQSARIQTNYRKLPYGLGWGLRLGVTAAVSRGMTPESAGVAAHLIAKAIDVAEPRSLRTQVGDLVAQCSSCAPFSSVMSS